MTKSTLFIAYQREAWHPDVRNKMVSPTSHVRTSETRWHSYSTSTQHVSWNRRQKKGGLFLKEQTLLERETARPISESRFQTFNCRTKEGSSLILLHLAGNK